MNQYKKLIDGHGVVIAGAGLAGLLAANFFKRYNPLVIESQPSLPNNHDALLRFRTDLVSKVTGIPFKKVKVNKAIELSDGKLSSQPDFTSSNEYSFKVTGKIQSRSIDKLESVERFIAPPNFISRAADGIKIEFSMPLNRDIIKYCKENSIPVISTIPMPFLMELLEKDFSWSQFKAQEITTITTEIESPIADVYQTIYIPCLSRKEYRVSVTGARLIIEMMGDMKQESDMRVSDYLERNIEMMFPWISPNQIKYTRPVMKVQKQGKLISPSPKIARDFIFEATAYHGVYSLGRFSTWRQILMDDCVEDCESIQRMIETGNYSR
jgi:hypothetical protein